MSQLPRRQRRSSEGSLVSFPRRMNPDETVLGGRYNFCTHLGFLPRSTDACRLIVSGQKLLFKRWFMTKDLSAVDRLKILQATDNYRPWYSLDDQRVCAICMRTIDGRRIEIKGQRGQYTLHCPTPGCLSNFRHWFLFHETDFTGLSGATPNDVSLHFRRLPGGTTEACPSWWSVVRVSFEDGTEPVPPE